MITIFRHPLKLFTSVVLKDTGIRTIVTSNNLYGKGRTYESRSVPGSADDIDPLAWAQRLFDLHEIRKSFTYSENVSPLLMVCRLKPMKGTTFYEKAILEKYAIGSNTKVFFIL